jgi:hypothetical protein
MPVEIWRALVPPRRTAFGERPLDFVHGQVRDRFLGIAYRTPGRH